MEERENLIAVLQKIQAERGCITMETIERLSAEINVKPARILGVVSFYAQFRMQPAGRYHIQICMGTACHVNASDKIAAALEEELDVGAGGTTSDGLFTLSEAACLGCCSLSPAMMINGKTYGSLTPETAVAIIKEYKQTEQTEGRSAT